MTTARVFVDLSRGLVEIQDGSSASTPIEADIDDALIDDVRVAVRLGRSAHALRVNLIPPVAMTFAEREQRASEIVGALLRTAKGKPTASGEYRWGRLQLESDLRGGGGGAHFTFYLPRA